MTCRFFPLLIAALALVGCNKDDVIEDDDVNDDGRRPITATSSPYQNKVYDYTPAPGQFINDTKEAGFSGNETTMAAATEYAMSRLSKRQYVSLGSFGGYITVGFDHSVVNTHREYDFAVLGNAYAESNEPGVVWVSQDTNHDGLPNDVFYELRGSETGKESTLQAFAVTYQKPAGEGMPVEWRDANGNTGTVNYLKTFHSQPYYFPLWVASPLTLTGTMLAPRNEYNESNGNWENHAYAWGYVDNMGSDMLQSDGPWTGFRIDNAIDTSGNAVKLEYIDFVKVQSAVLAQSGWLGELSCEVCGFKDCSMATDEQIGR